MNRKREKKEKELRETEKETAVVRERIAEEWDGNVRRRWEGRGRKRESEKKENRNSGEMQ